MRFIPAALALVCVSATACSQNGAPDGGTDVMAVDHTVADVAADQAHDTTIAPAYGICGQPTYNCLCSCPSLVDAGGLCQGNCFGTQTCVQCINDSENSCCPAEFGALNTCITNSTTPSDGGAAACGGIDFACQLSVCATQNTAFNQCIESPACATGLARCWGTYLVTCGSP